MRMRKKHNLDTRIGNCNDLLENNPSDNAGKWMKLFPDCNELHLEIGCGKGTFTAETAKNNPGILLVALEKEQNAMVMAMEKVQNAGISNVIFIDGDAANLREMFAPEEIKRIYLNFSDPWPKSRDAKFRLTAPSFLRSYADVLPEGGEIHFKTDNQPLFVWSCEKMEEEGWTLKERTNDLHANGINGVMTDYEARFYAQGIKINRVVAVKSKTTKDTSDGVPPRIRNAALSDARGNAVNG